LGNILQTTKNEPGHGLGLPALRRIVDRYSGEVRISDKNGVFSLEIMLIYAEPNGPALKPECQK
jgi:nitrogen fixation/metabolism regulation signal transduction histidine kinase